jgi:hypothetical protein
VRQKSQVGFEQGTPHSIATRSPIVHQHKSFLRRNALTQLETSHSVSDLQDDSGTFVAQSIVAGNDHGSYTTMFPEMNIGPADTGRPDMDQALVWA